MISFFARMLVTQKTNSTMAAPAVGGQPQATADKPLHAAFDQYLDAPVPLVTLLQNHTTNLLVITVTGCRLYGTIRHNQIGD